ncbi:hypothetical protein D9758_001044 [Tetrapyrgos nigripes]|uniref:BHLH domain-containing protein n=1 Tax=Tetrapyrgos nigripes TaxID=182062 RepID=A0A8H5GSC4_9AGAR|nr:hypothetical protein D9758_001044 [Tetrapyrgos nigripes]
MAKKALKGKQLNQKTLYDMFSKKQPNRTAQPNPSQKSGMEQTPVDDGDAEQVDHGASIQSSSLASSVKQTPTSEHSSLIHEHEVIVLEDTPSSPEIIPVESDGFISDSTGPIETSSSVINIDNDDEPEPEVEEVLESTGSHRNDPIILSDSPIKPKTVAKAASSIRKPNYSIFAPRPSKSGITQAYSIPTPPSPSKSSWAFGAPLPNRLSQHVRGHQSNFTPSSSFPQSNHLRERTDYTNIPLKSVIPPDPDPDPESASTSICRLEVEARSPQNAHLFDIPIEHQQSHPAIAHLVEFSSSENLDSHKLWTDKWRPTRADYVLGNEDLAIYLRDWLCALELQLQGPSSTSGGTTRGKASRGKKGTKRQRVVRAVDKRAARKKRRLDSDEDDWIVYSDEIIEEEIEEEEVYVNRRSRLYRRGSRGSPDFLSQESGAKPKIPIQHTFKNHLTNTILLTGGNGIGKTAAVYACAEELDWDVFEVYPGIGKRNGANLESLVGEVGRNHLVQGKASVGSKTSLRAMLLGKPRTDSTTLVPEDCQSVSSHSDEDDSSVAVRQSCILLEEVDILYKEDANFWPTVVNIIKDCRRPVILTCNDPALIPLGDLPLQTQLDFQPCPPPIAVSYLQSICRAEGYMVQRELISQLHHNLTSVDGSRCSDLRRIIHCLQLWCPMKDEHTTMAHHDIPCPNFKLEVLPGTVTSQDLQEVVAMDCYLLRNRMDTSETKPCMDEVVGYTPLEGRSPWHGSDEDRSALIMSTLTAIGSRGSLELSTRYGQELLQARVQYEKMVKLFGNNVAVRRSEIRRPAFNVDYIPWLRQIVAADDAAEAEMEWAGNRMTRNSQRYERTVVDDSRGCSNVERKIAGIGHKTVAIVLRTISMPTPEPSPAQRNIPPLAPLEYLQTQRRGSITDPSLHAAKHSQNFREPAAPTPSDPRDAPRPSSAYVFGDATPQTESPGLRKILRSPSSDLDVARPNSERGTKADGRRESTSDDAVTGMKRKMSSERNGEETREEMMDVDGPAPKRRMSSIDTARIAKLSLDDRRYSVGGYPSVITGPDSRPTPSGILTYSWPSLHQESNMHHPTDPSHSAPNSIVMMPPVSFPPDRRMSVPDTLASGPTRVLRSRSRPPSRQMHNSDPAPSESASPTAQDDASSVTTTSKSAKEPGSTPYSRSPELRVSHKLAERKRRREMKDLFDELRDQLPADRGMKASKWEILSKAIDFVTQLKHNHQEMAREIEMLKHEIDVLRQSNGMPAQFSGGPPHPLVYSQGPPQMPGPYPHPLPPPGVMQHPPPPPHAPQQPPQQPQPPLSRPASSQNMFPPSAVPSPQPNGTPNRTEVPPT